MKPDQKYYQLIPDKVLQALPDIVSVLSTEIKGFSEDYLKQVISIIACHVRRIGEEDAPLKNDYLRRLVPHPERYLDGLIDLGIIRRSPYYIPGEISYKYNFSAEFHSKYITVPLNNPVLHRRIKKAYCDIGKLAVKMIRGCSSQVKYLRQLSLSDGWKELVESYKEDVNVYNQILASATRIANGDFFYSRDPTEGRFHSNVTNMKRELREYLRVKGEPLVNVDIKNSQPYLSTIVLTFPKKVSGFAVSPTLAMLLQNLKVSQDEDVKKYIKLVADGQLYEFLMTEFTIEGITLTRDETKKQLLRILFAQNRLPKDEINRKCRLIFKDRFPNVHQIFSKVRGRNRGTNFENSNRFAILLATIESYLMIDVILKRIYRELPGVIAITIHDSIMTGILTNNVQAVCKIMSDELKYFVGFSPKIKIEGTNYKKEERERIREKERERNKLLIHYDVQSSVSLS